MSSVEEIKANLKALNAEYAKIKTLPENERKSFGEELNKKREKLSTY